MPPRDPVFVIERRAQVISDLTEDEAAALQELGRQLRGSGRRSQADQNMVHNDDEDVGSEDDDAEEDEATDDLRTAIRVSRRPNSAGWSITVDNAVGAVSVGDLQILVEPKIPAPHFAKLVLLATDPDSPRVADGSLLLGTDHGAVPAVWLAFLDSLAVTLRADLHHDYIEIADDPPYVRGRLDPRATAVNLARGRMRFPSVFEDLSVDNPVNRTLRGACLAIAQQSHEVVTRLRAFRDSPQYEVHRRIQRRAREASYHLSQAGDLRPGDLQADVPRLAIHQRRALMLARHILTGVGRQVRVGDCEASCYLQPTPSIAESAVRNLLAGALRPGHVVTKRGRKVAGLSFNPDIVIEEKDKSGHGSLVTGDVKYRIRTENWPRKTLEQAMAFRQVFDARMGFFVDFATGDAKGGDLSIEIGGVGFHRISWPAHESVEPDEAACRVVESCVALLDSGT